MIPRGIIEYLGSSDYTDCHRKPRISRQSDMRLSYVQDSSITDPADQAILHRIEERRGSRGLISLDRALLHSPSIADGWYVVQHTPLYM